MKYGTVSVNMAMKILVVVLNIFYDVRRYDAQDHAREYDWVRYDAVQ